MLHKNKVLFIFLVFHILILNAKTINTKSDEKTQVVEKNNKIFFIIKANSYERALALFTNELIWRIGNVQAHAQGKSSEYHEFYYTNSTMKPKIYSYKKKLEVHWKSFKFNLPSVELIKWENNTLTVCISKEKLEKVKNQIKEKEQQLKEDQKFLQKIDENLNNNNINQCLSLYRQIRISKQDAKKRILNYLKTHSNVLYSINDKKDIDIYFTINKKLVKGNMVILQYGREIKNCVTNNGKCKIKTQQLCVKPCTGETEFEIMYFLNNEIFFSKKVMIQIEKKITIRFSSQQKQITVDKENICKMIRQNFTLKYPLFIKIQGKKGSEYLIFNLEIKYKNKKLTPEPILLDRNIENAKQRLTEKIRQILSQKIFNIRTGR